MNDLGLLQFAELLRMRDNAKSRAEHNRLAPYEHRAFAREAVADNPLMALPLGVATPLYTLGKAAGLLKARSDPSLEEILQAYRGIGEGLLARR